MEPANTPGHPTPSRQIPTWIEDEVFHKPKTIPLANPYKEAFFPKKNPSTLSVIAQAVLMTTEKMIDYMQQFTEYWNLYAIRSTITDLEKTIQDLPIDIEMMVKSLNKYEMEIRNRNTTNIQTETAAISDRINHIALTILYTFNNTSHSAEKIEAAYKFSLAVYRLKASASFKAIWDHLTVKTKQVCDAVLPFSERPGVSHNVDITLFNFDRVYKSKVVLLTNSGLHFSGEIKNRENGAITFALDDADFIIWKGVKPLTDSGNTAQIEANKTLLSAITKAQDVYKKYATIIQKLFPEVDFGGELFKTPINEHNTTLHHQRYRSVLYYFQLMYASLGISVRLPEYAGPSSEYWIVSSDKPISLESYLKLADPIAQRKCARQLAEIFQKELCFGILSVKSCQFEVYKDKIYACDVEDSFKVLPDLPSKVKRLSNIAADVKFAYQQFPEFTAEFQKYVDLFTLDCEILPLCKKTASPADFQKILMLSHLCTQYDLSFNEVFHSKESSQEDDQQVIKTEVVKLFQLMPKKGQKVDSLYTKTHFEGDASFLIIDAESTLIDTQFAQYAHLERLIVKDLISTSLHSLTTLEEDFTEISLELMRKRYLPEEDESFYSVTDTVRNVGDYFGLWFWNNFIVHFVSNLNALLDDPLWSKISHLAWRNPLDAEYKELLDKHLIQFNKERQATDFIDKLSKV